MGTEVPEIALLSMAPCQMSISALLLASLFTKFASKTHDGSEHTEVASPANQPPWLSRTIDLLHAPTVLGIVAMLLGGMIFAAVAILAALIVCGWALKYTGRLETCDGYGTLATSKLPQCNRTSNPR